MFSYIQQLEKQADGMGVRLIDAFKRASAGWIVYVAVAPEANVDDAHPVSVG